MAWEVFDPRDGRPVVTVPWRWVARLLTCRARQLDFAPRGEGWLGTHAGSVVCVVIGDPASLYVCSEAANHAAEIVWQRVQDTYPARGARTVVNGSTMPRVPEVDLSDAELQTMIDAHARAMHDTVPPFTYHYHGEAWWALRRFQDRRLALETSRAMCR